MAIQIGKYKRPGIFVEEFDASVITSPAVTGGLVSLVMGFSKKGPVNTPILLQNTRDLENIFGSLDRNLERKGSFFHRTVSKMLETSPVYAINLMLTSDTADVIEYKSVSTRSDALNDVKREGPYRRFFDTTGFWKRDTEIFNNLVKDDPGASTRMLSFTNLSDRYITVFMFKAVNTFGFDRTLLEAYGTAEKVPLYLNPTDYASDYLVDVLVVTGDWTNYSELAVDTKWSQYFTPEGLRKNRVRDFANDRNITLLNFYEGISLIPYFKDSNGRNIFIENVINDDTDSTGLFCTFDVDKLEGDFPNGMIDLTGNNLVVNNSLVDTEQEDIEFLSYKETIAETITYPQTPLDAASGVDGQRVIAFGPTISIVNNNNTWGGLGGNARTFFLREGFIHGVQLSTANTNLNGSSASMLLGFDLDLPANSYSQRSPTSWGPYCVINGQQVFINGGGTSSVTFSLARTEYAAVTSTSSFISVAYVESATGNIKFKYPTPSSVNTPPSIDESDLVLGQINFTSIPNGYFTQSRYIPIGVTGPSNAFRPFELILGTPSGNSVGITQSDYAIQDLGGGRLRLEFLNTNSSSANGGSGDYRVHRRVALFNEIVNILNSTAKDSATLITNFQTGEKWSASNISVESISSDSSANKSITLNLGTSSVPTGGLTAGNFALFKLDNEFVMGSQVLLTSGAQASGRTGSIGKVSDFYTAYQNGIVNTGDWFYENLLQGPMERLVFTRQSGYDVVVFSSTSPFIGGNLSLVNKFRVPASSANTGTFTLGGATSATGIVDPITGTFFANNSPITARIVDGDRVTSESLTNITRIEDTSKKIYLDLQTSTRGDMTVRFTDSTLDALETLSVPNPSSTTLRGVDFQDFTIRVRSDKSNYKQTIEIEEPAGYTPVSNKILINASRYTELKVGDFLEAAVDETMLENGQVPKRLARIQRKRSYTPDPTLTEISTDIAINKVSRRGDLQTLRYVPITEYANTFKGMALKGFRVREASMPDGTEERQNDILNLVSRGTSLFGALINKEAFDFRYLVDAFGLGLTERSKQQLVDICGERLDALGIINMPSNKMFRDSSAVNFVDSEGVVQTEFIAKGGDPESNPAFLYSFGDGKGASCVGYFYPYVTVNDNGRPISVPPAAYIATTYMRKQTSALTTITPWTIAAGVTNGRVTNIANVEVNFSPTDIENLNGAQMNPITYKRNRGFVIETENTAQTLYKSALSYLHVREVLIELERELSSMLLEFQWRFNTADIRAEIKLRADSICEKYVNRNGLYNYFNKCDEENNTPTIIDNQIGVLDTYVEPIKGMGIIVNNITILRTGAIQAGGFIQS